MIKRYSDWETMNEVDELTEPKLVGKYFNSIVDTYTKHPSVRPSRDIKNFPNAKGSVQLGPFVKTLSGKTSSQILEGVVNNWYKWPNNSEAKKVILQYINNDDDLSNLAAFGVPFGKGILADPTVLSFGSIGKSAVKSLGKSKLFSWVPRLLRISESDQRINEGAIAAVGGFLAKLGFAALLSASTRYVMYGKESIEDDLFFSWTSPYLPDIKGVIGDDPIIVTYVTTFNTAMMMVYDAWNLCMGQEKYGTEPNPILNWNQAKGNYINQYYEEFYKNDDDISTGFRTFMANLKEACMRDMKNPKMFESCPFYYNGDKIRVNYDDGRTTLMTVDEWFKWVKDNYRNYIIIPVTETQFTLKKRDGEFAPLSPIGITDPVKGDPMRQVTIEFPDGKVGNISVLQLELLLMDEETSSMYEVESQNLTEGGSNLVLRMKEGADEGAQQSSPSPDKIATVEPSILKGSSLQEIFLNLKKETLSSFIGMGDI